MKSVWTIFFRKKYLYLYIVSSRLDKYTYEMCFLKRLHLLSTKMIKGDQIVKYFLHEDLELVMELL